MDIYFKMYIFYIFFFLSLYDVVICVLQVL